MNIFKKNMTLIADVFPKLWTRKHVVKKISKMSPFRGPFNKQHGKGDQTLLKSERHHIYHIYCSLWRQLSWTKFLLVVQKFLGLSVNTLTADEKYYILNRVNLRQPIQMQLSQKQKKFSGFVSAFMKSKLSFEYFQKK